MMSLELIKALKISFFFISLIIGTWSGRVVPELGPCFFGGRGKLYIVFEIGPRMFFLVTLYLVHNCSTRVWSLDSEIVSFLASVMVVGWRREESSGKLVHQCDFFISPQSERSEHGGFLFSGACKASAEGACILAEMGFCY